MTGTRRPWRASLAGVVLLASAIGASRAPALEDALAMEIERWSEFAAAQNPDDETWKQIREPSRKRLGEARESLVAGRRLLALQRLASAREHLSAWSYVQALPAEARNEPAAFEAEWKRMGGVLEVDRPLSPDALAGVGPAAVRALAEAALSQARVYYDASLEYGRNTEPQHGLFYLGAAQAQREFAAFCRTLPAPAPLGAPTLRPIDAEITALEDELLALYRPPASVDQHPQFIAASATLKEARELDQAGLRYGALLRYLQGVLRIAALRPAPAALEAGAFASRLAELDARLAADARDHSLGRLLLEAASAESAAGAANQASANAAAIAADALPRYFAALEPAPAARPQPEPLVTVTLVRWPYT
jgi:hypothetical protein